MTTNTTMAPAPATISKKELWALFVDQPMRRGLTIGAFSVSSGMLQSYTPDWLLRDPGMNAHLEDFADQIADEITDDDDPLDALNSVLGDLEAYVQNLKMLATDFDRIADDLVVYPDDDSDDEEYRYRHPGIASKPAPVTLQALEEAVGSLEGTGINLAADPSELLELVGDDEAVANLRHLADLLDKREAA